MNKPIQQQDLVRQGKWKAVRKNAQRIMANWEKNQLLRPNELHWSRDPLYNKAKKRIKEDAKPYHHVVDKKVVGTAKVHLNSGQWVVQHVNGKSWFAPNKASAIDSLHRGESLEDTLKKKLKEDAPTNSVGSGNMAGGGAMSGYSPFLFKHKKFKRARHKLRKFRDVTK